MIRAISKLSEQFRCVALSELPLEQAVEMQRKALSRFGPVVSRTHDSWSEVFDRFTPLRTFPRHYLVAGLGDWSLVLSDMIGESCLVDVLFHSQQTGCRAVGGIALPAGRQFFYIEAGEQHRDIQCFLEDRWCFRQIGAPLAIERPEFYIRRSRSERLPEHLVFDYISAITGISFPLRFNSAPSRMIVLERSWHLLQKSPQEHFVTNDFTVSNIA